MKKISLLLILVLFAFSATAWAQPSRVRYGLGGGFSVILSPSSVKNRYNNGFHLSFAVGYKLTPRFTVGGNLSFSSLGLDKDRFRAELGGLPPNTFVDGGTISIWEATGTGTYDLLPEGSPVNFYVLAASGASISVRSDLFLVEGRIIQSTTPGRTDPNFMMGAGLGMKIRLQNKVHFFIESRGNIIFGSGDDLLYLPLKTGFIF